METKVIILDEGFTVCTYRADVGEDRRMARSR
jgi:hypothetical protein